MNEAPEIARVSPSGGALDWLRDRLRNVAPFVTLIALVAFFWAASESFATLGNLQNILTQISVTGIIAVGLTFVILCAEIDLSVSGIANATGIVAAYFTAQDASVTIANMPLPGWAAILIALASCFALGAVNAFGLTRIGIPSFIMTLPCYKSRLEFARCYMRADRLRGAAVRRDPRLARPGAPPVDRDRCCGVLAYWACRAKLHPVWPIRVHDRRQPGGS